MVDCGDPGNPYGGYRHIATNTKYQSTVTYTCQPQHHLEGENSQVCQADGTWSGSKPVCLRKFVKVAWHSIFLGIPSIFGPLSNVLSLAPKDAFRIYPQHDQHVDNEFFVEGLSWCFLKAGVCVCVGGQNKDFRAYVQVNWVPSVGQAMERWPEFHGEERRLLIPAAKSHRKERAKERQRNKIEIDSENKKFKFWLIPMRHEKYMKYTNAA